MDICNKKLKGVFIITVLIILCLSVASISMLYMPNNTANAITNIPSQSTNLGEMLLKGYENSTTGKVFNGEVFWQLISQISGEGIADNNTISSLTTTKTSADFRSQNDGKDIVVTIGEKQWIATYLSTNYSGDPILTLWLANSSTKARWNERYANSLGKYPSNMYGTSEIRAKTLNNGGGYAVNYSDTELTLLAQDSENEWAIYTMDKIDADGNTVVKGSIKEFIEVPNNISWQHEQKAKDYLISSAYTNLCNYNNNNDALDMGGNGAKGDYSNKSPIDQAGYGSWAQDRLWLPSIAETGVSAVEGIWKTTTSTRANSENTWLRSADYNSYACAYRLTSAGTGLNYNVSGMYVTNSYGVRPAFHLNLAKVAESATAATPNTKGDAKKYYSETGGVADEITFELEKVNGSLTDIVIEATDMDGNSITSPIYKIEEGILTFKVSQVGQYVVKVTPKTNECWSDGSNGTKEYTYYLKYHVTPMRFAGDVSNLVYKGSKQYLAVENYKEEYMNITPSSGVEFERIPDGENAGEWGITATNAGEGYKVTVSLKNTEYMEWTDNNLSTPKSDLTFNISKKVLNVNVGSLWSTEVYTGKEYELELDCAEEDIGMLRFEGYYKGGSVTTETKVDVQPVMSGSEKKVIIKLPKLSEKGEYKYILKLAEGIAVNGNYTINCENTFTVGNKRIDLSESEIVWRYANASIENGAYKNVGELDTSGAFNVEYNGSAYSFEVNVLELREDIRDSIEYEYVGERSGVDVKVSGNIVENYTVTFKIKARNGNTSIDIVTSEFTLKWRVNKALLDLSNVKWGYTLPLKYTDKYQEVKMEGIPNGLTFNYNNNRKMEVGEYSASVISITLADNMKNNYIRPEIGKAETYKGDVEWTLDWKIEKGELELDWERKAEEDSNGKRYWSWEVSNTDKVEYVYYTDEGYANGAMSGEELRKEDIQVPEGREEKDYWVVARLKDGYKDKYEIRGTQAMPFKVGSSAPIIEIGMEKEFVYDGNKHGGEWYKAGAPGMEYIRGEYYEIGEDGSKTKLTEEPTDAGRYEVRLEIEEEYAESYQLSEYKIEYEIVKAKIKAEWESNGEKPELKGLSEAEKEKIEYEYRDENGNAIAESELENGKTYKVIAKIKSEYRGNYEFVDIEGNVMTEPSESGEYEFKYDDGSEGPSNPDDPNTPGNPDDPTNPDNPNNPEEPTDEPKPGTTIDDILDKVKDLPLWQLIASGISIILTIAFLSKTASNESKRKKAKKVMEKKYSTFYATAFLGISVTNWTVIASVLMGSAVLSLIFMVISQKRRNKAEEELEDAKDEYNKMMFMRMNGNGNMQGQNYGYSAQPAVGIEDMRCMINDAVSAMLPNVQQYLPQQASANDELVQRLIEQNEQNEERIKQLTEENKETINRMSERNDERIEKLMRQLAEQKPVEKVIEREVAATNISEEVIERLVEKLSKQQQVERVIEKEVTATVTNDETIKQLLKNQEMLIKQIQELTANQQTERVVEKIVEKPIEKIVEKEVVKKVKVEVPVEVEKTVPLPVEKPTTKAKTAAPRLTLDEAYAKLSAKQKKFFDTLKEYAMSKDKCKEKKSTYYILLGQSSVNPLVKLTIKKDCTVALFKMEDEYMKDIRRNAGSEGTKVKVKETELIVGDSQALATAKEMIDLREDQIERYNDFLKEQRSLRKK